MNRPPDLDLVLRDYFADDGLTAPDRVLDAVEQRIVVQRQRRSWPFPGRTTTVSTPLKLVAGLAAALVVAVVGYNLLPGTSGPGSPTTAPTPPPSPAATTSTTATVPPAATAAATAAVAPLVDGPLAAGTYRLRPFDSGTLTIDATVPEGGWLGGLPQAIAGPRGESNGPNGVVVAFLRVQTINSDPCHWDRVGNGSIPQAGDIEVGPTVDDLAEALAASSTYESTTPVDATLGGFSGKRLDLRLVPDPAGCDTWDGSGNQYFVFGGGEGGIFAQGDDNLWQVTIVDADGTRVVAILISYQETSAADLAAAQAILESVVITP